MANFMGTYKNADRSDAGNCRLVSLTCVIYKLMESLIREKVLKQRHNLICNREYTLEAINSGGL